MGWLREDGGGLAALWSLHNDEVVVWVRHLKALFVLISKHENHTAPIMTLSILPNSSVEQHQTDPLEMSYLRTSMKQRLPQ